MPAEIDPPKVVWTPDPSRATSTAMARFRTSVGRGHADYPELWEWSVSQPGAFWKAIAEFFDVSFHQPPETVLPDRIMPGADWFRGSTLNYAEHALRPGPGKDDDDLAVIFHREDGITEELTYGELRRQVAAARAGLAEMGVRAGDRVVALVPNSPHALIAFLATASLGAIWSSCSPDFGAKAIADRFTQLEPAVLITVDGYLYNGKTFDVTATVYDLRSRLPSLRASVVISYVGDPSLREGEIGWDELIALNQGADMQFTAVPFSHPLWVLYSSGTTGLPKGIVHGHGGIVLEHLKALGLHCDVGPRDRFFWFTTTGWMMWNFLVSGLLVGTTIVLYDGSPVHPGKSALWHLAETDGVSYFGTSAPFVHACLKAGLTPGSTHDLSALRAIGSTGAPLSPEGFNWIHDAVGSRIQIASVSGGTDLCTAFVGAAPDVPVWLGELSCRMLGAAVAAFDEAGQPVVGEVGELVITEPMPSMPVSFWSDPGDVRMQTAYFDVYPGVWRHGDWIKITDRGSAVIYGRSDATLNRGGVRMGTAEFYRVVEALPEVADSLVIDTSGAGDGEGELLCFLVLDDDATLPDVEATLRQQLRREVSPRHVPDRFIVVPDVPRTLNGKKCEVPVKKILAGTPPEQAISRDALQNPDSLEAFSHPL
jgi:acetoacetyl-CoA synthetase